MKIENLENLQEITIDKLSSVEGGMISFKDFIIDRHIDDIDNNLSYINSVFNKITIAKTLPPRCPSDLTLANKREKVIPLSNSYGTCYVVSIL